MSSVHHGEIGLDLAGETGEGLTRSLALRQSGLSHNPYLVYKNPSGTQRLQDPSPVDGTPQTLAVTFSGGTEPYETGRPQCMR